MSSGKHSVYSSTEVRSVLLPLLHQLQSRYRRGKTQIIGIQGGQGTGKTTLVHFLEHGLRQRGYRVVSFSIDDFYTSYAERKRLARKYPKNKFYQISRGLPGTHRVADLLKVLKSLQSGKPTTLPVFDKSLHHAAGDISKKTIPVRGKLDFVLFEGWCVGIPLVSSAAFIRYCRKGGILLEKIDPLLVDHKVVLQFIKEYQPLWKYLNYLVMLQPTSLELHKKWRLQQEKELKQKTGQGMTQKEIDEFVEPYLPFTYLCYEKIKPKVKILVNEQHKFYKMVKYVSRKRGQ